MSIISIHKAKTNLSRLIAEVEAGSEVIIARGKTPVAKLVPLPKSAPRRKFGAMRGQAVVGPEFFEPLPEGELEAWE